ncbi:c-type cytochrome [Sphingomonas adhaesiva]|uniref:c-type cytochrome n=1 Tax=Sphingomonas adhaesiva TaxID=28212 RepID=UPI002FF75BA2
MALGWLAAAGWRIAALASGGMAIATVAAATSPRPSLPAAITDPVLARSDYIEHCGGCHGADGRSAPARVPELRDRVGYFMCNADTRAYLVRLPNVAHSRITDNQQLADLVNFVVFGLGGASTPAQARPFTAAEVAQDRHAALSSVSLREERARHVATAIRHCHAPVSLRRFYPGEPG